MNFSFSYSDLYLLERARSERLRSTFPHLFKPYDICLAEARVLLFTRTQEQADLILEEWDLLQHYAWLFTGRVWLALYLNGQELEASEYLPEGVDVLCSSQAVVEKSDMSLSATLEKPSNVAPITEEKSPDLSPQYTDLDTLAARVASATGRDLQQVKEEILAAQPQIFVSNTAAIEILDKHIKSLIEMRDSLIPSPSATGTEKRTASKAKPAVKRTGGNNAKK